MSSMEGRQRANQPQLGDGMLGRQVVRHVKPLVLKEKDRAGEKKQTGNIA